MPGGSTEHPPSGAVAAGHGRGCGAFRKLASATPLTLRPAVQQGAVARFHQRSTGTVPIGRADDDSGMAVFWFSLRFRRVRLG